MLSPAHRRCTGITLTRAVLVAWVLSASAGYASDLTLTILHTSEHHGQAFPLEAPGGSLAGGLAERATLVQAIRREGQGVLLVDSGDILVGTAFSSWFRGEPDVLAMNELGYQAMAAGNHEFDFGLAHLEHLARSARFPILCSNLIASGVALPCRPYALVPVGKLSVGLLGLLGRRNFPDTFNREVATRLTLRDPVEAARALAAHLRAEGAHLVVAVTHEETEEDLALLAQVPELDVIVGGHTVGFDGLFSRESREPVELASTPGTVFVKTHRQGRALGRLDLHLRLDDTGRAHLRSARARNLPVTAAPDPVLERLLAGYASRFEQASRRIVGHVEAFLDGRFEHVRQQETNLGNLITDLLRAAFDTDVAVLNSGQIRASLPPGPVTLSQVMAVLPFDSSVVTLTLTGQQLRETLENSVSLLPGLAGRFLQVSGLSMRYDPSAEPGRRVREVQVGDRALEPSRRYSVATNAFLADGGDGYEVLQGGQDRLDRQRPLRDLLLQALTNGPLSASVEGRLQTVAAPRPQSE